MISLYPVIAISIHAPSRERPVCRRLAKTPEPFQSTLPHGSDSEFAAEGTLAHISIHAPSRERQIFKRANSAVGKFQSTLPHGSDCLGYLVATLLSNFNPRSLTGATILGAPDE